MKLGQLPLRASPRSVNWETSSTEPPTSCTDRFILPAPSSKMRSWASLSAVQRASSGESPSATPRRTTRPRPTSPATWRSTRTTARDTRCTTDRIRPS